MRNGRSYGSKVSADGHETLGLPQTAGCFTGRRRLCATTSDPIAVMVIAASNNPTIARCAFDLIMGVSSLIVSAVGRSQNYKLNTMAERVGFEPTERFPVHSISSAAS